MKRIWTMLLIVLLVQTTFAATLFPNRNDFRDESIYFVMTTRFYNGDTSNDAQCWDAQDYNVGDPAWRGDFKGLIEKLDYIKALGFTAIWITPVVENASGYDYHGYHPHNFSQIDKRLESEDVSFQSLIDEAHARGMKIILDIVLNHTSNFGEAHLCPMFTRDWTANQGNMDKCMTPITAKDGGKLPDDYLDLAAGNQYQLRLANMKNVDGQNHDTHNYWHHVNSMNWDTDERWWGQIAGDQVDLNTENAYVTNYLVKCYSEFIRMGVDGFRMDASGHISRLTFNKAFLPQFQALADSCQKKRNGGPFFMFGEVTARDQSVTYRNQKNLSPYYYTWKETNDYPWDDSETSWDTIVVNTGEKGNHINVTSVDAQGTDDANANNLPISNNAFLDGNNYHQPDYSQYSGLSVIDFPMHWNFRTAAEAFSVKHGDQYYNDASYNVVYVDSHDYSPDGAPEDKRFDQDESVWAENLSLMFTFRGIPCLYYGSEIQFKKGCPIDKGPNMALRESGRAYFGGYITGEANVTDFAEYSEATGNMGQTLQHPLAQHIQRLNLIRMAVPALRKGQYNTLGCNGDFAFKRRYTDATTDSYVLVTISDNAIFTNIENGTYVECVTGDTIIVENNMLSTSDCNGKGNLRVYVLSTALTPAPGKIGTDGKYVYSTSAVAGTYPTYDGNQEALDDRFTADNPTGEEDGDSGIGGEESEPMDLCIQSADERVVFFSKPAHYGTNVNVYMWIYGTQTNLVGGWPGSQAIPMGNNNYKFIIPDYVTEDESQWMIIWNDGKGNQTADLKFTMHGYYTADTSSGVSSIVTELCNNVATDDVEIRPQVAESLTFYCNNGTLYITSDNEQDILLHATDGRLIRTIHVQKGTNKVTGLQNGIYICNQQKMVIY